MKIVGVIPARYASTRLPGKSLVQLCGKPLVQWVYDRASTASQLSDLIIATDDDRIMQAVSDFGGKAVMTRADHPSGTDRIAEAVSGIECDAVINIQGDEPLISSILIDELASELSSGEAWDMVTAVCAMRAEEDVNNPAVVKAVMANDGAALYFSRAPIPFVRDEKEIDVSKYWRHIGIYGYTRDFLGNLVAAPPSILEDAEKLEQLRALQMGGHIKCVVTGEVGLGVDTPEDIPRAEAALRAAGLA